MKISQYNSLTDHNLFFAFFKLVHVKCTLIQHLSAMHFFGYLGYIHTYIQTQPFCIIYRCSDHCISRFGLKVTEAYCWQEARSFISNNGMFAIII